MMTDTAPAPTDLRNTLEEMRASVAAEGARDGLAGAMNRAFLKICEILIALLMDFRAGKLAPVVAVAGAEGAACPSPVPGGLNSGARLAQEKVDAVADGGLEEHRSPVPSVGSHCALRDGGLIRGRGMPLLERDADRHAVGAGNGQPRGGRGTREEHEVRASPQPRQNGVAARRTPTNVVVRARRRNARGIRRAVPPRAADGARRRGRIFEKCDSARKERRGDIVPA